MSKLNEMVGKMEENVLFDAKAVAISFDEYWDEYNINKIYELLKSEYFQAGKYVVKLQRVLMNGYTIGIGNIWGYFEVSEEKLLKYVNDIASKLSDIKANRDYHIHFYMNRGNEIIVKSIKYSLAGDRFDISEYEYKPFVSMYSKDFNKDFIKNLTQEMIIKQGRVHNIMKIIDNDHEICIEAYNDYTQFDLALLNDAYDIASMFLGTISIMDIDKEAKRIVYDMNSNQKIRYDLDIRNLPAKMVNNPYRLTEIPFNIVVKIFDEDGATYRFSYKLLI